MEDLQGANSHGQLGTGDRDDADRPRPMRLPCDFPTDRPPRQLTGGGGHTAILDADGRYDTDIETDS